MTLRARPAWLVLGLLWLVGLPSGVRAATHDRKCAAAKTKAFGAAVLARSACRAEALVAGDGGDPACLAKIEKKLAKRLAKADGTAPCPGGAPEALANAIACVAAFDRTIAGTPSCAARKLGAAGRATAGTSACVSKAVRAGSDLDAACLQKVEEKFARAFARADGRGSCTGTAADVEKLVDGCVDGLPLPIPCTGGTGHPTCDGTCPDGLTCRPYEVFANGASRETGCGCVDVATGP